MRAAEMAEARLREIGAVKARMAVLREAYQERARKVIAMQISFGMRVEDLKSASTRAAASGTDADMLAFVAVADELLAQAQELVELMDPGATTPIVNFE
jgi:hypothetical protein